jgi:hypothetical protein
VLQLSQFLDIIDISECLFFLFLRTLAQLNCIIFFFSLSSSFLISLFFLGFQNFFLLLLKLELTSLHFSSIFKAEIDNQPSVSELHVVEVSDSEECCVVVNELNEGETGGKLVRIA